MITPEEYRKRRANRTEERSEILDNYTRAVVNFIITTGRSVDYLNYSRSLVRKVTKEEVIESLERVHKQYPGFQFYVSKSGLAKLDQGSSDDHEVRLRIAVSGDQTRHNSANYEALSVYCFIAIMLCCIILGFSR